MIHVGLVDDDQEHLQLLRGFLARYEREEGTAFRIEEFHDGLDFAEDYAGDLDVVFLDVEMPQLDGMSAAKKIREKDSTLAIIFLTYMAQYAIHGYEVNAVDFIVKPVGYFVFADKLRKALQFMRLNIRRSFVLQTDEMIVRLTKPQILYIEKDRNYLVYHTQSGNYRVRGTMAAVEAELRAEGFSMCLNGCMVNLRYITGMTKDSVLVGETALPVSRRRRKEFKEDFLRYLGGDL